MRRFPGNRHLPFLLLLLLAGGSWPNDLQAQDQKLPQCDSYGDPLPPGAIARLGTLRLMHPGGPVSVAVSPNGKIVASGASEGEKFYVKGKNFDVEDTEATKIVSVPVTRSRIRFWDASSGKLLRQVETPDAPVSALLFDPSGERLYGGCGMFLCCWEVATGKKLWQQVGIKPGEFARFPRPVLIQLAKGRLITTSSGDVDCHVNHPNGTAGSSRWQNAIRIWHCQSGQSIAPPKALESTIKADNDTVIPALFHDVAIAPDARHVAVIRSRAEFLFGNKNDRWKHTDGRVEIIELESGKVLHALPDPTNIMTKVMFLNDSKQLAVAGEKDLWLVDIAHGKKQRLAQNLPEPVTALVSIDGNRLAANVGDDLIWVWDTRTGQQLKKHSVEPWLFTAARNGYVAANISGNSIRLHDLSSGKALHDFPGHRLTPLVRYALHSKNTLISRDADEAHVWDTTAWKVKTSFIATVKYGKYLFGRDGVLDEDVSVEKQLRIKDTGKQLELRHTGTGELIRVLQNNAGSNPFCCFSADGKRLMTYDWEFYHFFDVATGKQLAQKKWRRPLFDGYNCPDAVSPLGNFLATNHDHNQIDLVDLATAKTVRSLVPKLHNAEENEAKVLVFNFSSDKQTVLAEFRELIPGRNDRENVGICLWDTRSGKIIHNMVLWPKAWVFWRDRLSRSKIHRLAISNDQRLIAYTEPDGKTIQILEVASGGKRGELAGHLGPVADVAFSPDGRQLASSSEDTTILIWDLHRPLQPGKFKKDLNAKELDAHWQTLFQSDAKKADTAIWSLIHAARDSVPFLKQKLQPVQTPDAKHVKNLIDALGSDKFVVRSKAQVEIEKLGDLTLMQLTDALKQPKSLEQKLRLENLLEKSQAAALPFGTTMRIGMWRAVEVLEKIGTAEAKQVLRSLADGAPGARLTEAARAAVDRLQPPAGAS